MWRAAPKIPQSDLGDARLGFGARPLPSMWRAEVPYPHAAAKAKNRPSGRSLDP